MAIEIEHKFLLANNNWRNYITHSVNYQQGYLSSQPTSSIRIRISNNNAWINIKSATIGESRNEYEYEIPFHDANEIIQNLCKKPIITKTRYFVTHEQHIWEIDEFHGENEGLIVAEIELTKIDESYAKPDWVGNEVTYDLRYYNNNLANKPYSLWTKDIN
ncbi:MAG: hypothetical protein RIT35_1757 [Pseudomonadota bacterium]|jgi:adenylate cyclase